MNDVKLKILVSAGLLGIWGLMVGLHMTNAEPFVEAIKGILYGVCGYHAGSNLTKGPQ